MGHCSLCTKQIDYPYECSHCGNTFCADHRLPENHLCVYCRNTFSNSPPTNSQSQTQGPQVIFEKKSFHKKALALTLILVALALTATILIGASLNQPLAAAQNNINNVNSSDDAYNAGYNRGLAKGNSSGYAVGFQDGQSVGFMDGQKTSLAQGYVVRDPTYLEMNNFLATDLTNLHQYNEDHYNCYDYAKDVCNHAQEQGIRVGFVYVELSGQYGHALVAFNTTDRGLIYIEPQGDLPVSLIRGQPITVDSPYWRYTTDMSDTVIDFGVIW
jgi:hypothetical protein